MEDPLDRTPGNEGPLRASDPDVDPFEGANGQDSWEPPSPALGGFGQLVAAVVAAFVAAAILVGAVAVVSWILRFR